MARRTYGTGGISKRTRHGVTTYQVRIPVNGKRKTVGYARTKREARALLTAAIKQRDTGTLLARSSPTLAAYLKHWMEDVMQPKLRPQSFAAYDSRLDHVAVALGTVPLSELRTADIQGLYADLYRARQKPASIRMLHRILKAALRSAMREDYLTRNPAEFAEPPKVEAYEPRVLTVAEVRLILTATQGDPWYPLWVTMLTTGIRIGEALGLLWEDIGTDSITIAHSIYREDGQARLGPTKTPKSRRHLPCPPRTIAVLREHERQQRVARSRENRWDDPRLVFPNCNGGVCLHATPRRAWHATLDRLGIERVRLHDMRHTVASHLIEDGEHIQAVQRALGHANVTTTLGVYSHLSPAAARGTAEHVERLYGGLDG